MLQYDRIDISEGIDVNKRNASKECDICYYWYFKDIGFNMNHYFVMFAEEDLGLRQHPN